MSPLRRYYKKGDIYFVTNVTYERKPILIKYIDLLWQSFRIVYNNANFDLIAWVILPDHMHLIIDPKENNLSDLLKRIKLSFSKKYLYETGKSGRVWQYRFWDHIIRNNDDLNNHLNYIHYNPVKHSLVNDPSAYKYSSLAKYIKDGCYENNWGVEKEIKIEGDFGE